MTKSGFEFAMTLAAVRKLSPCKASYDRVAAILPKHGKITASQARDAGCTLDDMVWLASTLARVNPAVERRVMHWAADCAAHVLHIYERDHPTDRRPRAVIKASRDFADGKINTAALAAARAAAREAARDAAGAAAWDAAWAATWEAAWDAAGAAARAAARDAARDATWEAARAAARAAEEQWQFDRLVLWLSAEEPTPFDATVLEQAA